MDVLALNINSLNNIDKQLDLFFFMQNSPFKLFMICETRIRQAVDIHPILRPWILYCCECSPSDPGAGILLFANPKHETSITTFGVVSSRRDDSSNSKHALSRVCIPMKVGGYSCGDQLRCHDTIYMSVVDKVIGVLAYPNLFFQ